MRTRAQLIAPFQRGQNGQAATNRVTVGTKRAHAAFLLSRPTAARAQAPPRRGSATLLRRCAQRTVPYPTGLTTEHALWNVLHRAQLVGSARAPAKFKLRQIMGVPPARR